VKTYLISLFSPDGPPPEDLDLTTVMADLEVVNADIRAAGGWVFAGGLADQSSATTLRRERGAVTDAVLTDGPFAEAKELIAGYTIIQVASREEALAWVKKWPVEDGDGEVELELRELYEAEDFGDEFTPQIERQEAMLRQQASPQS
jgi:hypothetical protein